MPGTIAPIGIGTAIAYARQATAGAALDFLVDPGDTNAPVVFEPPPGLTGGAREVWCLATGGPDWGGCQVWISTSGDTYALAGTIYRGARQGLLSAPLPDHADPDTANTLSVDLTMSRGLLLSGTEADADNLVTLCYAGGELVSYQTATLTAAYRYDLAYLRRGAYGSPSGAHASGSAFARFGPNDPSLLKYPYPENYVGQTLYLKFPAFNIFGQCVQSLADVMAYPLLLTGGGAVTPSFEVAGSQTGVTTPDLIVGRFAFCNTAVFPDGFMGSRAVAASPAAADAVYSLRKNGSAIGTMVFPAGGSVGTFTGTGPAAFSAGDVLTVVAPASPDAALAGLAWTLLGRQGRDDPSAEVHGSQSGVTPANLVVCRWVAANPITFPADLAGSVAVAAATASGTAAYTLAKNGIPFATMTFGPGAMTATFGGTETIFDPGDVLTIAAPSVPDASLADLAWALCGANNLAAPNGSIAGAISGPIPGGLTIGRYVFAETMLVPAGMAGSAGAAANAGSASTAFDIRKNGASIGTMSFAAGAVAADFAPASATVFNPGDVLTIVASGAPDAALAGLAWALAGTR
jgi:hypothetical protein